MPWCSGPCATFPPSPPPSTDAGHRGLSFRSRQLDRIAALPAAGWDALFPATYPFTRHAYLAALEAHGCVGPARGWEPCHLVLEDEQGTLQAACPLYYKQHSYGEFVFDFAWARASQSLGRPYYPKLLCAIPYTPSTGPRLGARSTAARTALVQALTGLAPAAGLSSSHVLFADDTAHASLDAAGWLTREDVQYHWHNRGYGDFAQFLAGLRADKRKKILRERRRLQEAGLRYEVRAGHDLDETLWQQVYRLYAHTYEERGQPPYLSPGFFLDYGRRADTALRVILGWLGDELAVMALTLVGGDTLYGRHWGALAHLHSAHFETCYYQGIDYCIRQGLAHYDAGTQGEHKLTRGFEPVRTRSLHQITEPVLAQAISSFLRREGVQVEAYRAELRHHMPYRTV